MALHDPPDVGEPDARALELVVRVQPLEHAEQLVRVLHVEAVAVVAHEDRDLAGDLPGTVPTSTAGCGTRDEYFTAFDSRLISDEPQQRRIPVNGRQIADRPGDVRSPPPLPITSACASATS